METFEVQSSSSSKVYRVTHDQSVWKCTCLDARFRPRPEGCKHVQAVQGGGGTRLAPVAVIGKRVPTPKPATSQSPPQSARRPTIQEVFAAVQGAGITATPSPATSPTVGTGAADAVSEFMAAIGHVRWLIRRT